jgi:hypothetical protein
VLTRAAEIDGNLYYLLDPAAQLIEGKAPVGRDPAPAGHDRGHTRWREILPQQTCCRHLLQKLKAAMAMMADRDNAARDVAAQLGVSLSTLYAYIDATGQPREPAAELLGKRAPRASARVQQA